MRAKARLGQLLSKIETGSADSQEKIDATYLLVQLDGAKAFKIVRNLVEDVDGNVRYFALQVLVMDMDIVNKEAENLCWKLLAADPDEGVRGIAAACLGKILYSSGNANAFARLKVLLENSDESNYVKKSIVDTMIELTGKLPPDWLGPMRQRPDFSRFEVDWNMIDNMEKSLAKTVLKPHD